MPEESRKWEIIGCIISNEIGTAFKYTHLIPIFTHMLIDALAFDIYDIEQLKDSESNLKAKFVEAVGLIKGKE